MQAFFIPLRVFFVFWELPVRPTPEQRLLLRSLGEKRLGYINSKNGITDTPGFITFPVSEASKAEGSAICAPFGRLSKKGY
jgi:hypothetical protein